MKKIFTVLLAGMALHQAQAQTITSASFPNVGEIWVEFIDITGSLVTITPAGAGQTWNYGTSFNVGDTSAINFRPLSDAPAYMDLSSTFSIGDMMVLDDLNDSSATVFESNSTGFYFDGVYDHGLFVDAQLGLNQNYVDFNPNRLIVPAPFAINDTRDNNAMFELNFTIPGLTTVNTKTFFIQSFEADASGTLTTPMGTFNNVLRIKEFTYQLDSTTYVPPFPGLTETTFVQDTSITYIFLHANYDCLLMTADVDPITLQVTEASYYDPIVAVGNEETNTIPVSIYPNPAGGEFYLNHIRNNSTIQIFDVTGKLINNQYLGGLESNVKVNTSDMPAGFYFFSMSNPVNGNYFNGKFEVVK
jgi:hypothetical protein